MDFIFDSIGNWLQSTILGSIFNDLNTTALTLLVVGFTGLALLLISILLDGVFEMFDFGGDGILSVTTISAFIAVFGFAGLIANSNGASPGLSSFVGAIAGVAGAALSIYLTRLVKKIEGGSSVEESTFEGLTGVVTIPIKENGLGEITISTGGERHYISARCKSDVAKGEKVIIKNMINSTSAFVEKFIDSSSEATTKAN